MAKARKWKPKRPASGDKSAGLNISDRMPEIERARVDPTLSLKHIDELWPGMSPQARRIVSTLAARSEEIERWFLDEPTRIRGLAANPQATVEQLAKEFGLDGLRYTDAGALDVILEVNVPSAPPLGATLLEAVWDDVARQRNGFNLFMADTQTQIRKTADRAGASDAETDAVIDVFKRLLKRAGTKGDASVLAGHRARAVSAAKPGFTLRVKKKRPVKRNGG